MARVLSTRGYLPYTVHSRSPHVYRLSAMFGAFVLRRRSLHITAAARSTAVEQGALSIAWEMPMRTGEAAMTTFLARSRDVQRARSEPARSHPPASLRDTLVLLLAIGAVVVACGVVTVLVLHPISSQMVAERVMAIVAG